MTSQWTINGGGTVSLISYVPTTTSTSTRSSPPRGTSPPSCVIQAHADRNRHGDGIDNFEIRSGLETICTFDNTKKQAGVTLRKVWVDGKAGDTAALTLSRPGVTANATSTAPDAPGSATRPT